MIKILIFILCTMEARPSNIREENEIRKMNTCETFENWSKLSLKIKQLIISKMDYITKNNLSRCSKSDSKIVNDMGTNIFSIGIVEKFKPIRSVYGNEPIRYVQLSIWFDSIPNERLEMKFVERPGEVDKCYFLREWAKRIETNGHEHSPGNYRNIAFQTVIVFLKKGDYKLERLNIEMDSSILQCIFINILRTIKIFQITSKDYQYIAWWLGRMRPLKSLIVGFLDYENKNTTFSSQELIRKLSIHTCSRKSIFLHANAIFSDENFFDLNSTHIHVSIDERSMLTIRTINEFIKRWISGEIRSDFTELGAFMSIDYDRNDLLDGLNAKEWDDEFREQWYSFCHLFVTQYKGFDLFEIRNASNNKAGTLQFYETSINFVVTGELNNGHIYHRVPHKQRSF